MRPVHSQKLERFLGTDAVERLSRSMRGWYGPPIIVSGVPGIVYAQPDGDFSGKLACGGLVDGVDWALGTLTRHIRRVLRGAARRQFSQLNAGFSSLSDMINDATVLAKRREFAFQKSGPTGVANTSSTLWRVAGLPAAGAAGSAAPGGRAPTSATTGGYPYTNPSGSDILSLVSAWPWGSVGGNTLLLYDRLFDVAKTMSNTGTEAVTGVPTRYTNTTGGSVDSAEGNFLFIEVFSALANTGHNWTVCKYTNQAGTTGQSAPSMAGNAAAIIDQFDHPVGQWFMPLASGDTGISALTQMQCDASVTGSINFVVGHPLAWMPIPIASLVCEIGFVSTTLSLPRIFNSACMALIEVCKPSTTATNYLGQLIALAG